VRIGKVAAFGRPGQIFVQDVVISNTSSFATDNGLPAIRVSAIHVDYDLPYLLWHPRNAAQSVNSVVLDSPTAYIERLKSGKFNFSDLFNQKTSKNPQLFFGEVTVHNGTAVVTDNDPPKNATIVQHIFRRLTANIDFGSARRVAFSVHGDGDQSTAEHFSVRGEVLRATPVKSIPSQGFGIDIRFTGANAARLVPYVLPKIGKLASITGGVVAGQVAFKRVGGVKSPYTVSGDVTIADGRLRLIRNNVVTGPVSGIRGALSFTRTDASFSGAAVVQRQSVALNGTLLNFSSPQLYVEADSTINNYPEFRSTLPFLPILPPQISLRSAITVHSWIAGPIRSPSVDATVEVPVANSAGYDMTNIVGDLSYINKTVVVHSLSFNGPRGVGQFAANGLLGTTAGKLTYSFVGQARGITIASLPLTGKSLHVLAPLNASLSGVFKGTETGIEAEVACPGGTVHGIPFEGAEARLSWHNGGPIMVDKFFLRQPGSGILVASGSIPTGLGGGMNVQFHAAQISLTEFEMFVPSAQLHGLVYLNGTLTGAISSPQINVKLYVLQPQFNRFEADGLRATISGDENRLTLSRLQINHIPGRVTVNGSITDLASGRPSVDLTVGITNYPISYIAALSPKPTALPISGFVSGTGHVTGQLNDPYADAALTLDSGNLQTFELTDAGANLAYHAGRLTVNSVHASTIGIAATGFGIFNLNNNTVALKLNVDAQDLAQVTEKFAPDIQLFGGLSVIGSISGQVNNPVVSATVSTDGLGLEGTKLTVKPTSFSYFNNNIQMTNGPLILSDGKGDYLLKTFDLNMASKEISATGSMTGETLPNLLTIVQSSPHMQKQLGKSLGSILARMPQKPIGNLTISSANVVGPIEHPVVGLTADLTDANIGGQAIDRLDTQVITQSTKTTLKRFLMTGPNNAYLDVHGTVDTAGAIDASAEASGFNLSLLDPYLPHKAHASGVVGDLTIVASGQTKAPELAASLTLDKPAYNTFSLDRIDSGEIDVKDDHITISDLVFTKEEVTTAGARIDHTVEVAGSIPFEWKQDESLIAVIPVNVPLSLTATLPDQSLEFVNQLFPQATVKVPTGNVSAKLNVTGTLANKSLNGQIMVSDAALSVSGYQTSLKNLNIGVQLSGQNFTVQQFSAISSYGGALSMTGGGTFTGNGVLNANPTLSALLSDLTLSLDLTTKNLVVDERKIALFNNAGVTARINNGVTIEGPVLRPLIKGEMDVDQITGSLPQTSPTTTAAIEPPKFNPKFDVTVTIKPSAHIKTSQLNSLANGSMVLTGSFYRPRIDGTFLISKGQFYFPTATFKVVPVGTLDFHYHPPDGIDETIDLTATTSITVSPDILARNPAGVNDTVAYVPSLTSQSAYGSQRYVVTVAMHGSLESPDKLQLTFQSNPPGLTNSQILAVLGGQEAIAGLTNGNMQGALQTEVASVFNASVVPKILQPLEDSIGTVLGLEDFSIDYAPDSPVQVTFVKRLGDRLSVTYTQSVNSRSPGAVSSTLYPPEYQVKLGYSFTPRLSATISTDDQQNNIVAIEGIHNF
jgi:hypothetical protein